MGLGAALLGFTALGPSIAPAPGNPPPPIPLDDPPIDARLGCVGVFWRCRAIIDKARLESEEKKKKAEGGDLDLGYRIG